MQTLEILLDEACTNEDLSKHRIKGLTQNRRVCCVKNKIGGKVKAQYGTVCHFNSCITSRAVSLLNKVSKPPTNHLLHIKTIHNIPNLLHFSLCMKMMRRQGEQEAARFSLSVETENDTTLRSVHTV